MGEGSLSPGGFPNTVRTMAARDICEADSTRTSDGIECEPMSRVRRSSHHERGHRNGLRGLWRGHRRTAHRSRAEWRAYDDEERERTGAPLTAARPRSRPVDGDRSRYRREGDRLSGQKRRRLARMRREQTRGRWRSAERNLAHGLGEVRRLAEVPSNSPDSVRDQACGSSEALRRRILCRGRSIEAIAVASIYGACRCNGHWRLLDAVGQLNSDQIFRSKGMAHGPVSPSISGRAPLQFFGRCVTAARSLAQ